MGEACPLFDICLAKGVDSAPVRRRQAAYATSDRRVRGAILKVLRESGRLRRTTLRGRIRDRRFPELLDALALEGLIEIENGMVQLPS